MAVGGGGVSVPPFLLYYLFFPSPAPPPPPPGLPSRSLYGHWSIRRRSFLPPPPPLSGGDSGRTAMDPWPPMSTETNDADVFPAPGFFALVCPSARVVVAVASPDRQTRGGRRAHTRPYSRSAPALSADPARKTSPLAPAPRRHVTFSRIRLGGLLAAFAFRRKWDHRGPRSRRPRREMSLHLGNCGREAGLWCTRQNTNSNI